MGGNAAVVGENAGIVAAQAVEHRLLPRTGNQDPLHPVVAQVAEDVDSNRHHLGLPESHKIGSLDGIKAFRLLGRHLAHATFFENLVDDGGTRHPLIEVEILLGTLNPEACHHLHPCAGVSRHGIVEHAVHIDKRRFERKLRHSAARKICRKSIFYVIDVFCHSQLCV